MQKQLSIMSTLVLLMIFSSLSVGFSTGEKNENPFTPKAFAIRYWDKAIRNNIPKPSFLLNKASPLSAVQTASFAKLAAANTLSTRLPEFCAAAHLLCFQEVRAKLEKHTEDGHFSSYNDAQNFTNYGTSRPGGSDSFQTYSDNIDSIPVNDFRRYSHGAAGHNESFTSYGNDANELDESFHTYGTTAAGGVGEFKEYSHGANVPELRFTAYSTGAAGREQRFSSYSEEGNAGDQSFSNYGKNGVGAKNDFSTYGTDNNVVGSSFSSYAEKETSPNDTFTNYGNEMNNPTENFKNYAHGSVGGTESFENYRDQSNVGLDSFQSYGKESSAGVHVDFKNYGKTYNEGRDTFKGYAQGADSDHKIGFNGYGFNDNATFKSYAKDGVTFAGYIRLSESEMKKNKMDGNLVKRWVEPGKFFREEMLNEGTVMPMPDIRDKMPPRSFLPRYILSKMPFSSSKASKLKSMFKASDNSSMDKMIMDSLGECERAPSQGETKRCVGSIEDMIDFATFVLGRNVVVRSTENVNGSKSDVMVGRVKGINGGKVTESVSCHQSLFPYLLYYCHSVPKVRVYEADLLDPKSKGKINHGVAICHLDTSSWSPTHGAFLSLGSGPGKIEVCHWIFENDMTWTIAD